MSRPLIDLTGKRFGRLVVLERAEDKRVGHDNQLRVMWRCRCDCGAEHIAMGENLTQGKTQSCGCLRRERCGRRRRSA